MLFEVIPVCYLDFSCKARNNFIFFINISHFYFVEQIHLFDYLLSFSHQYHHSFDLFSLVYLFIFIFLIYFGLFCYLHKTILEVRLLLDEFVGHNFFNFFISMLCLNDCFHYFSIFGLKCVDNVFEE